MSYTIKRRSKGKIAEIGVEMIFSNENHRLYTASDIEIAREYNVSRLTILNIRKQLSIKSRNERIIDILNKIDTTTMTLKELSVYLGVKYPNLHKIVKSLKLKTRPAIRPIKHIHQSQSSVSIIS
jgi:hypothetical protein